MQLSIKTNFPQVLAAMKEAQKQVPFAVARALTKTAQDVKEAERKGMAVFDRPTPFTLNSLFIRAATKQTLEAEVWLKGDGSRDGGATRHYLGPQVNGGARPLKLFERRLVKTGYMNANERAVPAAGVQLDSYGNVSKGQLIKILSQLKTATTLGDFSNASGSRRSRSKRVKEAYFFAGGRSSMVIVGGDRMAMQTASAGRTSHLAKGIWVRRSFGSFGTAIKPVLLFVQGATYKRRFNFFDIANKTVNAKFAGHFEQSFKQALATARFKE